MKIKMVIVISLLMLFSEALFSNQNDKRIDALTREFSAYFDAKLNSDSYMKIKNVRSKDLYKEFKKFAEEKKISPSTQDSVFNNYLVEQVVYKTDDKLFRKAIIKVLQKTNNSNRKIFYNLVKDEEYGPVLLMKKMKGVANINQYNGWNISMAGIFVVFFGLLLIAAALIIFNLVFAEKSYKNAEPVKKDDIYEEVEKESIGSIPDEELVAIATALELYKRLYADSLPTRLTFTDQDGGVWKMRNIFSHRQK